MHRVSSGEPTRSELIAALDKHIRYSSGLSVMLSQAMADKIGINPTDLETLDLLTMHGPVTAGRLAELTGLTTGAITGIVDRLERAGHVRRETDPRDRRRVIVHLRPEQGLAEIAPLYVPLAAAMAEVISEFSDEELATLVRFLTKATAISTAFIANLRAEPAPKRIRSPR